MLIADCVAPLLAFVLSAPAVPQQVTSERAPIVTEAQRREILKTVEQLTPDAFNNVRERAEAGDVQAQVVVAIAYRDAKGTTRDEAKAVQWLRKAAESGHPMAENGLGNAYLLGTGVPRDTGQAVSWYRKAADRGYAPALSNLGWAYYSGEGVGENSVEGIRLLRLAAEQGNATALNRVGVVYAQGKAVPKDDGEAVRWYQKAADLGDILAQRNLAQKYNSGVGIQKDYTKAAEWYRKAAEQGDPESQSDLGVAYAIGEGVKKDRTEAEAWFTKSSDLGYAVGTYFLGQLYWEKRHSVAIMVAMDKFEMSAQQGYPVAAYRIATARASRLSPNPIGKDDVVACTWFRVADGLDKAKPGIWDAARPDDMADMRRSLPKKIDKYRKDLKPEQQASCEARANEWLAKYVSR